MSHKKTDVKESRPGFSFERIKLPSGMAKIYVQFKPGISHNKKRWLW